MIHWEPRANAVLTHEEKYPSVSDSDYQVFESDFEEYLRLTKAWVQLPLDFLTLDSLIYGLPPHGVSE